jgi:adenosylhomocysteine nucleosidase
MEMSKIGIIGAMELEVEELKSHMTGMQVTSRAGMDFCQGTLHGAQVVIVRSGVGKVNASLCVQILADLFQVTHVINTGVAGSLNSKLEIGDIVISKDAVHHDMDVTPLGYKPGIVPQMAESYFKADEQLMTLAQSTCQKVNPDIHIMIGRVASGDQFITNKEVKNHLITTFHADCVEMEGASIAHGCYLNQIPFVILRAISDKADGSGNYDYQIDYPTFEKAAAKHCATLVEKLVETLAASN